MTMARVKSRAVIQLNQWVATDSFPAYVAIYSPLVVDSPFALSPNVMLWRDDILLCKVDDCEQFWLAQRQKIQLDLNQLFDQVLSYHFGDEYLAVFANHPWQCLVYLDYQINQQASDREVQRCTFLQSLLNRNIYKLLGWQFWFSPQQTLTHHLEHSNAKQFNAASFRSKQAQLKRFINRLGLTGPFDLQQADAHAITRRFDVWAGKIWRWTFLQSESSDSTNVPDLLGFPWIPFAEPLRPTVSRDLEYPLNQWSHINVLLCEDFEKLCLQFDSTENEHINRMLWKITLFNDQAIEVELSFRHPYSLHRESPEFKTAMYQAWYVYDDLMRKLQRRDKDLDLPESMPLVGWSVEVCERIQLPPVLWDLFGHESFDYAENEISNIKLQDIRELQNKLPSLIEAYHCEANFCPEQSFEIAPIGSTPDTDFDHLQWSTSSNQRPLFYHLESQQIDTPSIQPHQFLERCASRWWLVGDSINQNKDYYVLKDNEGHASWVYRDGEGYWYKQGEYC
ncbi:MAG: hypothetical protein ACI8XX_002005 [Polaribacter sp.]|jgi:hypothetical protein